MSLSPIRVSLWIIIVILWLCNSHTYAQRTLVSKPLQPYVKGKTSIFGYYEYLPSTYHNDSTAKFPILIYLSGLGSKGNGVSDLDAVLKEGLGRLISEGEDFPFPIMIPQSWSGWWSSSNVDAYLDYLHENYRIDRSRVYITGFSAGGAGAFEYAVAFPDKITAIIPISGRGDNLDICEMADVPVWAFHNIDDPSFSFRFSTIPINNLNQCTPNPIPKAKITVYSEGGHDAWTKTYDGSGMGTEDPTYDAFDENIFDWLLHFAKDTIIVDAGEDQVIFRPQTTLEIDTYSASDDGQHDYLWTQISGPEITIQDQTLPTLTVDEIPIGEYVFQVTVEDKQGKSNSDTVNVRVRPPNEAPSVFVGAEQAYILPIDSVALLGFVEDPESDDFTIKWEQEEGPEGTLLQFDSGQVDTTYLVVRNIQQGVYTFRLSATDEYDSTSAKTVRIRVIPSPAVVVQTLPHIESFEESIEAGWRDYGAVSSWAQGKPEGAVINQASDGEKVWGTNLVGDYQENESSFLLSPIFDFSALTNDPVISYDIWQRAAPEDHVYLSVTTNQGTTWQFYSITTEENDGSGWARVFHSLREVAGQSSVMFRFGVEANTINRHEGIAIDNVVVCSAGKIASIPDTMLVEGEVLRIPIELDNPDISEIAYQVTSSNQEILPDQNMTISENILEITSPLQVEGDTEITVSSEQACIDGATFTLTLARVTAIGEPDHALPALLYPNPGTGLYQVKAEQPIREIRLYGVTGRLLKVYPSTSSTAKQFSLDINDQPNGIYHLQVETAKQFFRQKLIKY
ncbi:MAG: T9SS type A sorting domain-containing protein [Bacteroidota bacterium]